MGEGPRRQAAGAVGSAAHLLSGRSGQRGDLHLHKLDVGRADRGRAARREGCQYAPPAWRRCGTDRQTRQPADEDQLRDQASPGVRRRRMARARRSAGSEGDRAQAESRRRKGSKAWQAGCAADAVGGIERRAAEFRLMPILFRDYETRSTIDLKRVGGYKYATHASTDVWCCAYAVDDGPVQLWTPGMSMPAEFIEAANNPDWLVSAFNDTFERRIEEFIMAPRYGWPTVPIERHRCSQAAALAHALPAKLAGAAAALGTEQQKDAAGHRIMLQMSRPRAPRAGEDPNGIYWFDDDARREKLYAYCKQDVVVERALHQRIRFLSDGEQKVWELDAIINDRGIYLDGELIDAALRIASEAETEIARDIAQSTDGTVTSISQVDKLIAWLAARGLEVTDLRKPTLRKLLAR